MSDLPNLAKLDHMRTVIQAIDYVLKNLNGPLPLANVAHAAGLSPFHFYRIWLDSAFPPGVFKTPPPSIEPSPHILERLAVSRYVWQIRSVI